MALSANTPRNYSKKGIKNALPVQASSVIFVGSAVSIDAGGEVGPLLATEGFVGFAREKSDNTDGAAGDISCEILCDGEIELVIAGMDDNSAIGEIVYATDDGTFTMTALDGSAIGRVSQIVSLSGNKARVKFMSVHNEHWND